MLTFRRLEKHTKGIANHRRIQIMVLLAKQPGLSLIEIAQTLQINFKTASEHTRRLDIAGLIYKKNRANAVEHRLTPRGKSILKFLRTLE